MQCFGWNFVLANEQFAKDLWSFETYVLFNNSLCGKLFSLLESSTTFDERFKAISVPYFIPNFNLSNWELENITLHCYIASFYIDIILKQDKITILSHFLVKNIKWFLLRLY